MACEHTACRASGSLTWLTRSNMWQHEETWVLKILVLKIIDGMEGFRQLGLANMKLHHVAT